MGIIYSLPLRQLSFSFQKKIVSFFVLTVLMLAFIFYAVNKSMENAAKTAQWVEHTGQVLFEAEKVRTELAEIQSAARGFLITNNENYLPMFAGSSTVIHEHIQNLKTLTKDNHRHQTRIDTLDKLVKAYIISRKAIINERRQAVLVEEKIKQQLDEGKEIADSVRGIITSLQQEENQLLVSRKAQNDESIQNSGWVILFFQIITGLLMLTAFMVIFYNTRQRNMSENSLRKNEQFIRSVINNTNNPISIRDLSGKYLLINKSAAKIFDREEKDITGKSSYEFLSKEMAYAGKKSDDEIIQSKSMVRTEARFDAKDGTHYFTVNRFPLLDDKGNVYAVGSVSTDITEIKKAEEALQESELKYRNLSNSSPIGFTLTTLDGKLLEVNPAILDMMGFESREEMMKIPISELYINENEREAMISLLKRDGFVKNFECQIKKRNGEYIWLSNSMNPFNLPNKDPMILLASLDITQIKKAEKQIRELNEDLEKRVEEKTKEVIEKEQQYHFLLQNMQEGIQVIGYDWKYLFVNKSVVEHGKYSNEELLGHTMMEKYPGIENTELFKTLQRCMKERTATVFENEFTFPDGTKEWFELSIQPVPEGLFVLSMDITERKKTEDEKIRLLNTLQKSLNEIYTFTPHTLQFQYVNIGALSNLGYSDEEIKKLTPLDLKPEFTEQKFKKLIAPLTKGEQEKIVFFTHHKRKNGSLYPVEIHLQLIKQGNEQVFLAVILDITDRKKAEEDIAQMNKALKKRAAELQASNAELERFAYVASHDLQEPLRMVSSFMGLLQKKYNDKFDDTARSYIRFAVDGAERMKKLILDLLLFSQVDTHKEAMEMVNCNELMEEVQLDLLSVISESKATLRVNPLPNLKGYKSQLQQLFQNLIGNAIKYRNEKLPLIEISCQEKEKHWQFCIQDNGIGIDPKFFEKIFIIFQRLHNKDDYSGTGIGLAIARKIVERHGGTIWVESEPGQGSSFYFTIEKKNTEPGTCPLRQGHKVAQRRNRGTGFI